jgi:hypothetical protein
MNEDKSPIPDLYEHLPVYDITGKCIGTAIRKMSLEGVVFRPVPSYRADEE